MTPTPHIIAANSLRRRRLLLAALFWLAMPAFVMTGGLDAFQLWQLAQFDTTSWLALSGLGGVATLALLVFLLRLLLARRGSRADRVCRDVEREAGTRTRRRTAQPTRQPHCAAFPVAADAVDRRRGAGIHLAAGDASPGTPLLGLHPPALEVLRKN